MEHITAAAQDSCTPNVETVSQELPLHVHLGGKVRVEALTAPRFSQPWRQPRPARETGDRSRSKDATGPVSPKPKRVARQRSRGPMSKPASMPNLAVSGRKNGNLSEVPGYKRSLTLMRGNYGPLVDSPQPLVRPQLDPCSHIPRSFHRFRIRRPPRPGAPCRWQRPQP